MASLSLRWLEKKYKKNKLNFTIVYFVGLLSAPWKIFTALPEKHKPYFTDLLILLPLAATLVHFALYIVYKFVVKKYISYSGVGRHNATYTFDMLTRGGVKEADTAGDLLFKKLEFSDYLQNKFKFPATQQERKIAGEINYLAFSDTIWSGKNEQLDVVADLDALNKKIQRNSGHLLKNPKAILLIMNSAADLIGFTHVIPVSSVVWEKYLRGEIEDVTFSPYNVCGEKEAAYGLIIFSIGKLVKTGSVTELPSGIADHLSPEVVGAFEREQERISKRNRKDLDVNLAAIFKGVLFQMNELAKQNMPNQGIVPVLVQIEDDNIRDLFKHNNFIKHKIPSKDGYDIYTAHLIMDKSTSAFVD